MLWLLPKVEKFSRAYRIRVVERLEAGGTHQRGAQYYKLRVESSRSGYFHPEGRRLQIPPAQS